MIYILYKLMDNSRFQNRGNYYGCLNRNWVMRLLRGDLFIARVYSPL